MDRQPVRYFVAGTIGGLTLFLIEAIDQTITLAPFIHSLREQLGYLALQSLSITAGVAIGLMVGSVAFVIGVASKRLTTSAIRSDPHSPQVARRRRRLRLLILLIVAIILAAVFGEAFLNDLMKAVTFYAPQLVERNRVLIDPVLLFLFALALFVALILAQPSYILLAESFSRRTRLILLVGLLAIIIYVYRLDSRFYFGLYETTLHRGFFCFGLAAATLSGFAAEKMVNELQSASRTFRRMRAIVLMLGGISLATSTVGLLTFNSDESLRALFMHRNVVGRRYISFLRWLGDRDGDGFSAILRGGDCDDRNPAIHPAAREIAGNGIDENCRGGDRNSNSIEPDTVMNTEVNRDSSLLAGKNIVLITIDALRADHLGCYGYDRPTSPQIDRFASQSIQFMHAYSQSTSTGHSFASMLRSAYGEAVFDENRSTFIEILARQGYQTAFIQQQEMVRQLSLQPPYQSTPNKGVQVNLHPDERQTWSVSELTDRALAYLTKLQPTDGHFVWIHYFDPHDPYERNPGFDLGDREIDLYDGEIAQVDDQIRRLLAFLDQPVLSEKTLVIISADHGETFLEHGQVLHASMAYQETIRVPLIIRHPGRAAERIETSVGLIDLAPTILSFVSIQPPAWYEGIDLLSPGRPLRRPIFTETSRATIGPIFFNYAMIDGEWKMIYDFVANTFELYNLTQDPREQKNLIRTDPSKTAELKNLFLPWMEAQSVEPIRSGIWSLQSILR